MSNLPPNFQNIQPGFQPQPGMPINAQMSVLIFMKSLATPVVLYSDNPAQLYEEMKGIIKAAKAEAPKLIEKPGSGPLKKVAFLDTEISGAALQSDPASVPGR